MTSTRPSDLISVTRLQKHSTSILPYVYKKITSLYTAYILNIWTFYGTIENKSLLKSSRHQSSALSGTASSACRASVFTTWPTGHHISSVDGRWLNINCNAMWHYNHDIIQQSSETRWRILHYRNESFTSQQSISFNYFQAYPEVFCAHICRNNRKPEIKQLWIVLEEHFK